MAPPRLEGREKAADGEVDRFCWLQLWGCEREGWVGTRRDWISCAVAIAVNVAELEGGSREDATKSS